VVTASETTLKFNHSPLTACDFLYQKFCNNSAAPEEVNLNFMLLDVKIDPSENLVTFTIINQNRLNVYLLLGGSELVNNTGLTVEIGHVKYFEKVVRVEPSPTKGEEITLVPAKMSGEPIFIILEPLLRDGHTMFILNRYVFSEADRAYRRKSQTLQVGMPTRRYRREDLVEQLGVRPAGHLRRGQPVQMRCWRAVLGVPVERGQRLPDSLQAHVPVPGVREELREIVEEVPHLQDGIPGHHRLQVKSDFCQLVPILLIHFRI
jgi:hypothetical protein